MASFAYGNGREPVAVSLLDENGQPAVTTRISRDAAGPPVAIDDGRVQKSVAYNRFGYPTEIKDVFGNVTKLCYNTFNVPVKVIDVNGIVTEYEYNADGLVTSVTRKDGVETLASVSVAYDESARPVSVRDQDGRVTAFDRDEFGRVLRETFADGSEVAYTYDAFGRRTSVLDENGHRIAFDWNRFGLSSRTTCYEYDAAGRLVREGNKTYTYGYLDKVMSVRDGANTYTYTYHPDGQLATADYGNSGRARTPAAPQGEEDSPSFETFTWDGFALIQRGDEHFLNEPHVGGGNPVVSSKGTSYFNDMLGTTVGAKSGKTYSAATLSAFGEDLNHHCPPPPTFSSSSSFFTGKPAVAGLGHAFLMRNYRASLSKWQTADPMGYPDGWNQLAYCRNGVTGSVDLWGCSNWDIPGDMKDFYNDSAQRYADQGNRGLLEEVTKRTEREARNCGHPVVYQNLLPVTVDVWDEWSRTGNTMVIDGVTWYEEKSPGYCYWYDVTLALQKIDYGSDYWLSLIGSGAIGVLGGFLTGGWGWVAVGAGIGAGGAAYWLDGQYGYIPIGLTFEFTHRTKLEPKTRWVE